MIMVGINDRNRRSLPIINKYAMAVMVVIYEDDKGLRESLINLMEGMDDLLLLGAFGNAAQVVDQVSALQPDLILMDIDMPLISGIDAVQMMRKAHIGTPVIMLTVFEDNKHVLDAILAGASGYLLKSDISGRLFSSIDEVLKGGAPMSPTVARMVVDYIRPTHAIKEDKYGLTPKEKEILHSLANGNSYKMVAAENGITIETVRSHIKNMYEKLQVHSQTEAVVKAFRERLL